MSDLKPGDLVQHRKDAPAINNYMTYYEDTPGNWMPRERGKARGNGYETVYVKPYTHGIVVEPQGRTMLMKDSLCLIAFPTEEGGMYIVNVGRDRLSKILV